MGKLLQQMIMWTQGCSLTWPRLAGELERSCSGGTGDALARCHTSVHTSGQQSRAPNLYDNPTSPRAQLCMRITHFYEMKSRWGDRCRLRRAAQPHPHAAAGSPKASPATLHLSVCQHGCSSHPAHLFSPRHSCAARSLLHKPIYFLVSPSIKFQSKIDLYL